MHCRPSTAPAGGRPRRQVAAHGRTGLSPPDAPAGRRDAGARAPAGATALLRRRSREGGDRPGVGDPSLVDERLVVGHHRRLVVDVVHHQARGLEEAGRCRVAHPVDPFEPGAVAQVEPRHRVERVDPALRTQQVMRAQPHQAGPGTFAGGGVGRPVGLLDAVELHGRAVRPGGQPPLLRLPGQPPAEAGDRGEGGEPAQPRDLRRQLPHHLLDEEVAEGDPGKPPLAVADGVEDGGVRLDVRLHLPEQQVRDRAGQPLAQRDLDEDERLVGQRGMEEPEAAPVRLQAAAQVVPVEHLVHRLVLDDLLQHEGRRAPVDAVQLQESAVEPGAEHMHEVVVHELELRAPGQRVEQGHAHRHDVARSVRGGVHQAQQLLAPRLGRRRQRRRGVRIRRRAVAFEGRVEGGGVGAQIVAQELEEPLASAGVEAGERIQRAPGQRHHRRLPLGAEQGAAQLPDVLARAPSRPPAEEPLPRRREARDDVRPECPSESHGGSFLPHLGPASLPLRNAPMRGECAVRAEHRSTIPPTRVRFRSALSARGMQDDGQLGIAPHEVGARPLRRPYHFDRMEAGQDLLPQDA